ncbi:hypothetical protein ACK3SF_02975 [Candidatus Nanosalina sp. VS9-1]|uniref:hypothetical protein n=1 Tax=Candidatus Nanosalina sp. VS9-1 TaxID=3388566 RepID=UPI0039E0E3BC
MSESLDDFLLEDAVPRLDLDTRVSLALLAIGEKPAASVKFMDSGKKSLIEDFLSLTDMEHLSFETEMHHKYYIARDLDRFQMLDKVEKDSPYHTARSEGLFLGYPESAVGYFVKNSRKASQKLKNKARKMIDRNLIEEEKIYYLDLVPYIPEVSAEGIIEAVEHGRIHEKKLREYDEENNSSLGEGLLKEVFERSTPYFMR